MKSEIPSWLQQSFYQRMAYLTRLWDSAEKIMKSFDESKIEYVPLKGIVAKDYYPNKFMRQMSDIDILIHEKDYENKIKPIMKEMNFTEGHRTDYEIHWIKGNSNIEFHDKLIPNYNKDFYQVIGDGWEWIKKHSNFEYSFLHFAKHYRDSGIGIGHFVDLELLWENADLEVFNLGKFSSNIRKTLDCWFGDVEFSDIELFITNKIFESGQFGKKEVHLSSSNIKKLKNSGGNVKVAKTKDLFLLIFPTWQSWIERNPLLRKLPFLLPFFWIARLVSSPFKGNINGLVKKNRSIGADDDYSKQLEFVGIDYFW